MMCGIHTVMQFCLQVKISYGNNLAILPSISRTRILSNKFNKKDAIFNKMKLRLLPLVQLCHKGI